MLSLAMGSAEHNLDGFVVWGGGQGTERGGYVQVFRNGAVEAVDADLCSPDPDGEHRFRPMMAERFYINAVQGLHRVFSNLGVDPPVFLFPSLVEMETAGVIFSHRWHVGTGLRPFYRGEVLLPEVYVETFDADPGQLLRPVFDALWNAVGQQASPSYDADGSWHGAR